MNELELQRLIVRLIGDSSSFDGMMKTAQSTVQSTASTVQASTKHIDEHATAVGKTLPMANDKAISSITKLKHSLGEYKAELLGLLGIGGGAYMLKHSIGLAAEAESSLVSFEVMLGSAEKAKNMMDTMRKYSSDTHLSMNTLHATTKQLLQSGVAEGNVLPITKMIGDITGGDAFKFQHMALAYGQMSQTGRLQGQDLMQFMTAGFNPLQQIAEDRAKKGGGTSEKHLAGLRQEMSEGKISVQMVTEALANSTKEGGRFFGMVEKQAKTLQGSMATLESEVSNVFRTLGENIIEGMKLPDIIQGITDVVKSVKEWLEGLDPVTKKTAIAVAAVVAGFATMTVAAMVFAGVLSYIAAYLSPIVVVIGLITAATAAWVVHVGGLENAWKIVKKAALDAWEWLRPIRGALILLWDRIMVEGQKAWEWVKDQAIKAWKSITGEVNVNWERIQYYVTRGIIGIIYTFDNLKKVWGLGWAEMRYQAISALNSILDMDDVLLALINPLAVAAKHLTADMRKEAEQNAKANRDLVKAQFMPDFDKFYKEQMDKINEIMKPNAKGAAHGADEGVKFGESFVKSAAKEMKKLDAALYDSVEAWARVMEFQDGFKRKDGNKIANPAMAAMAAMGGVDMQAFIKDAKNGVLEAAKAKPPEQDMDAAVARFWKLEEERQKKLDKATEEIFEFRRIHGLPAGFQNLSPEETNRLLGRTVSLLETIADKDPFEIGVANL